MADAFSDPATIGVVALGIALIFVMGFVEMRFLRKKMKNRRIRAAKNDSELPDEAHNAIITTKAIAATLDRQGIRSPEVGSWLEEAELAYGRGNYRVSQDLVRKAKDRLMNLKASQASKGDLAKLEQLSTAGGEEITTKELLQKEVAPNLLQSKFSIELAGTALEQARTGGRDVGQATELLEAAKGRFESKDYDGALRMARLSKRAAEGQKVEVPAVAPPSPVPTYEVAAAQPCPSCGAPVQSDDTFCRKCGARLEAASCPSCGASLLADDAYCRKCGRPVAQENPRANKP
jgi:predicted RNA-binding Zn-ribbon protein involved in translation (DUF1610 family)